MSNVASTNNQIIDIVAPSHRAYPPESYLPGVGGIPGEGFEVWAIDIPGNAGYNQWNDASFPVVAPAFGEIMPNFGTNNLSYIGRFGGTSAACPQVSAVAALILSVNNTLTQQQVFDIITQSAEKVGGYTYNVNGWSPELGNGRLNACAALSRIPNRYSITGNNSLCTTSTYSVSGLPTGSIIAWSSSNNNIATISASGVATKVGNGSATFTAVINIPNRCGIATTSRTVTVGPPTMNNISCVLNCPSGFPNNNYCSNTNYNFFSSPSQDGTYWANQNLTYYWSYADVLTNQTTNVGTFYGSFVNIQPAINFSQAGEYNIQVVAQNECGTSSVAQYRITVNDCYGGWGFKVSPNPSKGFVEVTLNEPTATKKKDISIHEIRIIDKMGYIIKQFKDSGITRHTTLNINELKTDLYYIRVFNGKEWKSQSLIKQ